MVSPSVCNVIKLTALSSFAHQCASVAMFPFVRDRVIGNLCFNNISILEINNKQICPIQITEMPNLNQLVLKQFAAFDRQPFNKQTFIFTCLQKMPFEKNNLKKMKVQNSNFSFSHIVFSCISNRKLYFIGLTLKNSVFGVTRPTHENRRDSTFLFLLFGARIFFFFFQQNASRSY